MAGGEGRGERLWEHDDGLTQAHSIVKPPQSSRIQDLSSRGGGVNCWQVESSHDTADPQVLDTKLHHTTSIQGLSSNAQEKSRSNHLIVRSSS